MQPRKELIKVVLLLEAINIASTREKSIRYGHPNALTCSEGRSRRASGVRGRCPMGDDERARISRVAAEAVAVAMRVVHEHMPEASEVRGLLLIIGNAAISSGRLRVDREDFLALAGGSYEQGLAMSQETSLFFSEPQ